MSRTERWLTRSVRPEPLRKSASQQAYGRRGRALLTHPAHRPSAPERTFDVLRRPDIFTCYRQPLASTGAKNARAIIQEGGKTATVPLEPAEPNKLVGTLAQPLGTGARVVVSVTLADGHAVQARFVNN